MYAPFVPSIYPVTSLAVRLDTQTDLLLDYLRDIYHQDLTQMLITESLPLLQDCFRQFSVFLIDIAPVSAWWTKFLDYAGSLLVWLDRPVHDLCWVIRSQEFASYVTGLRLPTA